MHALRARLYLLVAPHDLVPPNPLLPGSRTSLLMCLGTKQQQNINKAPLLRFLLADGGVLVRTPPCRVSCGLFLGRAGICVCAKAAA